MVMRRGGTFFFLAFGGLTLIAAIWLSVETFPNLGFSDADPLSAVISLLAFAVSLASLYQGAALAGDHGRTVRPIRRRREAA
jgi:hypothetical protein